jgi:hypothetical protein
MNVDLNFDKKFNIYYLTANLILSGIAVSANPNAGSPANSQGL